MIRKIGQAFVLDTAHTTYAFSILPGGHPEHLYYGRTIHIEHPDDLEILVEKHVFAPGNVNICEKEHAGFSLEDVRLEMSSYGKGDIREPFVEAILYDGAKTLDFRYEDAVITGKKDALDGLPGSYGSAGEVQQLCVTMVDRQYDLKLLLYYYVYEAADVIGRSAKIVNASSQDVQLTRLMSLQLDFDDSDYIFTTFRGAWAREMHRCDQTLTGGRIVNDSFTGTTSSRANSFVMLSRPKTGEDQGDCGGQQFWKTPASYGDQSTGIFVETGAGSTVSGTGGLYDLCTGWMGRHEPADACVYPGAYRARILEKQAAPGTFKQLGGLLF